MKLLDQAPEMKRTLFRRTSRLTLIMRVILNVVIAVPSLVVAGKQKWTSMGGSRQVQFIMTLAILLAAIGLYLLPTIIRMSMHFGNGFRPFIQN